MSTKTIIDASKILRDALSTQIPCAPLSEQFDFTTEEAYQIQHHNISLRLENGARIIGRKVGLTSHAIQSWLGVDQPDFGTLLDDMEVPCGGVCDLSGMLQPRAEGEVAFVMGADLDGPVTIADIMRLTEYVLPSIEIIDSRIADWKITFNDTVADNASSGRFVLGTTPVLLHEVDLRLAGMAFRKNGRIVSTGAGAACMDHPLHAIVWLANTLLEVGDPIREGDVVLSGALGPVTPVEPGDHVEVEISGLGKAAARFSRGADERQDNE